MDERTVNRLGAERISSRQIDELIGLSRGIIADGNISFSEVAFLQKWLAANVSIADQPVIRVLYNRVSEILSDGIIDEQEHAELLDTLERFAGRNFELGEVLKSTSLPLSDPAPALFFPGALYCFTGTFSYGNRKSCEAAVISRGAVCAGLSKKTDVLVIGVYATESWKHSAFGNKILHASEWQYAGVPIAIVCEEHWMRYL